MKSAHFLNLIWLCSVFSPAQAATRVDTERLAAHLTELRGYTALTPAQFRSVQTEFLTWIDARVKAGASPPRMNAELKSAELVLVWPRDPNKALDEGNRNHAGYLGDISLKSITGTKDIFVIVAGIYKGSGCTRDETAILYERHPLSRLGNINATDSETPYYLAGIDAGEKDRSGRRLVASGWVASNCTSTWNGKQIRIDRVDGSSSESLLSRWLNAQDRFPLEDVSARIKRDTATFWYSGGISDTEILSVSSVARYRIKGSVVTREAPIALTRIGFVEEWLTMPDAEALRWGEPEAVQQRSKMPKRGFASSRIVRCGGIPGVWEVLIRTIEDEKTIVFRIQGTHAMKMRLLAINDQPTSGCIVETKAPGVELPW